MGENPYESPKQSEEASITPVDRLRGPALACLIVSVLAICGSFLALSVSVVFLKMLADLDRPELQREVRYGFIAASFWFAFGVSGVFVAVNMRKGRRRWLIIAWSVVAIGTIMLSPLGIVLLMRLWRKDVWQLFK